MLTATLQKTTIFLENTPDAQGLVEKGSYGTITKDHIVLSFYEALYLVEQRKLQVVTPNKKPLTKEQLMKKALTQDKDFWVKYCVYADMRKRGYVVKTALKYGAEFRVYDRGIKPGQDHAKWILYPVAEKKAFTWYEFAAKNRVAHSTRKKLLIAVVDEEAEVTYYEIRWIRP